jgi:hypothetical protein
MADEIDGVDKKIRSDRVYGPTVVLLPLLLAGAIPGAEYELRGDGEVLREVGTGIRSVPVALARGILKRRGELPKVAELPKVLRFYADYIEVVDRLVAHHAPKGAALLKAMMPLELIRAAKVQTGRYFRDEIATLLEAANFALGVDKTVDARNLKMQHWRRASSKK